MALTLYTNANTLSVQRPPRGTQDTPAKSLKNLSSGPREVLSQPA